MSPAALAVADRVVARSDARHPADLVLREVLKSERGLSPLDKSSVSQAVFARFRWLRWLNPDKPIRAQIDHALELNQRFVREPHTFSDNELLRAAFPDWVRGQCDFSSQWIRALYTEPVLWLRARPGGGNALAQTLGHSRAFGRGPLADALRYSGTADLFRSQAFHGGEFEVQDLSSQAVGLVCAPAAGETWWDACAGQGGKTLHLADLMQNKGLIWASDRAPWRLRILRRRAARARIFNYRSATWDGSAKLPTRTAFDGVLLDAPCSGLGTWQRNPHARWTTTLGDVTELSGLQQRMLRHAAAAVKPGGKLIYAVCTLTRSETASVVDAFAQAAPEFEPLELVNPLFPAKPPSRTIWIWPQDCGSNGMFVAAWRRKR